MKKDSSFQISHKVQNRRKDTGKESEATTKQELERRKRKKSDSVVVTVLKEKEQSHPSESQDCKMEKGKVGKSSIQTKKRDSARARSRYSSSMLKESRF